VIEIVFTFMMVISCDLKTYRELESKALNNSQDIEEMLEDDIRTYMRRNYYAVKIKNMIAKRHLKERHDN